MMDYYNFTDPLALILQDYGSIEEKVESKEEQVINKGNLKIKKGFLRISYLLPFCFQIL
jgi:gamma-glutamylcysteine synthetase